MSDMEFTFEDSGAFFADIPNGTVISAARFLTLMEGETEDAVEDALLELENRSIMLDISDLPKAAGTGEAAVRLRREAELVKNGTLLTALEENDPLRLYLEEIARIPAAGDPVLLAQQSLEGDVNARNMLVNVSLHRVIRQFWRWSTLRESRVRRKCC